MIPTNNIMMIRPVGFRYNEETAVNNKFQQISSTSNVQRLALRQFNDFITLLSENEVEINVFEDTQEPSTPDALFPNNWISFHEDGTAILYPMFAENRRAERRPEILEMLSKKYNLKRIIDLSYFEGSGLFLEGTGSMVLDRENKVAYTCLSPRSDKDPLYVFCEEMGYLPVTFEAVDSGNHPIYHTNVMMCIGTKFVVICNEAIKNENERHEVIKSFERDNKEIIEISLQQMVHFAGNMIEIANKSNEHLLVMSEQAYLSLNKAQISCLTKHAKLIYAPLDIIEQNGGGSARCMITEIFLSSNKPLGDTQI
jgi:hypothetical protein